MPRSSPAFEVAVRNQPRWQLLIATLVSCASTCALLAVIAHQPGFWPSLALVPVCGLLAWRMALAKDLLRREGLSVAEVAERVGYGSASTFSVAFARHVRRPPLRWARGERAAGSG